MEPVSDHDSVEADVGSIDMDSLLLPLLFEKDFFLPKEGKIDCEGLVLGRLGFFSSRGSGLGTFGAGMLQLSTTNMQGGDGGRDRWERDPDRADDLEEMGAELAEREAVAMV
jgi:hypothetical protein